MKLRRKFALAVSSVLMTAGALASVAVSPAHAGTITNLPGQPAITDYQPPSGAGSNSVPYEHQGALIVAGQSQLGSQPIKDASAAGATVLGYLDPMVIQPNSGTWGDMLWQSSKCGPAVPQWGSYTTGTGYSLADFRTATDGGNGIEQSKLKCVLEDMISVNPQIAGFFADDLGSMSWYPGIPWGSFGAQNQQEWRDGAIALAQTFHDVAVEHHDMLMVNGTWEAGTLSGQGGGYPLLGTPGLSLADGGYIEHHDSSELSFWTAYAQGQWGTETGDVSQGKPFMYVQASDQATLNTYMNAGVFSYGSYQTDYSQPAPVWGSFHATGLPSSSTTGSGPTGPCVNNSQTAALGNYTLQGNEWNSSAAFTACSNDGGADFTVTTSGINNPTNGAPGGYPSLYMGCHWGSCTPNNPFPVQISAMSPGAVTTSAATTTTGTGAYDDAYDIWFNSQPSTSSNSDANSLEMMIWLNSNGGVQPAGSQVGTVTIGGASYNVWKGGSTPGGTLSYVATSPVTSVSNLDLGLFANDAVNRGYVPGGSAAYLIDVEHGFEIWQGGQNLADNSFSVSVSVGGGTTQQAPAVTTTAASGVTSSGATANGTVNPEGASTTYQFDYGTSTSYGSSTTAASAGSGTSAVAESASLTGLSPSTTYHYRIEATNSAGTSYGSDQTFTTSAAGGTSVAFDHSAGAKAANTASLSWLTTVGTGSNRALLVDETVGVSDAGCVPSATYDGIQMTEITAVHSDNQRDGVLIVWGLASPPSGTDTVHVAISGCTGGTPKEMTGGSESFTGVSQTTPWGAHATSYGSSGTASVSVADTSASDLVGEFVSCGSAITGAVSPVVQKFLENEDGFTGAGNTAGGYAPGANGTVTGSWNETPDWYAAAAVPVNHA